MREGRVSIIRYCCVLTPMLAFLWVESPDPQTDDPAPAAERQHNRQLLQKWKGDPEHSARLQRDLRAFWALPDAKRQQLRQLDAAFQQLDARARKRLWRVADRYVDWLERLPEDERHRIEETENLSERLDLIRTIRERQWIESLPRKVRDELMKVPPAERSRRVARLREEERLHRVAWRRPLRAADRLRQPSRLAELPVEAKEFVEKQLLPHLTPDERKRFEAAQGHWPEFADTVKELARKHPVLPPLPKPVVRYEQLPEKAKIEAGPKTSWEKREDNWSKLQSDEGKWPEWALTFHSLLEPQQRHHMPPLGASRPGEFPAKTREFIGKTLSQKATVSEWRELRSLEGKWPDYPLRLLRLAEKHHLEVPGMSLPIGSEW